ncbi:hypothetical protein [Nostoc sp.]|uniref:hypothetical protein n=1 Tax=Nostoc sp. TaxID=1180 RepID=UPI002FF75AA4
MRNSFIPYEVRLRLHTESIETIINALLEKQETLYSHYSQALSTNDDFEQERYSDDLADWNYELIKLAELLLVDISHWVEREMKLLLASVSGGYSHLARLDMKNLSNIFSKRGVDLEKIPQHWKLYVLRLFANSWKHGANPQPSEELCKALKIDTESCINSGAGLLTSKEVSKSLGSLLNLTEENSKHYEINIVRAYAMCAYNYLTTLEQKLN